MYSKITNKLFTKIISIKFIVVIVVAAVIIFIAFSVFMVVAIVIVVYSFCFRKKFTKRKQDREFVFNLSKYYDFLWYGHLKLIKTNGYSCL